MATLASLIFILLQTAHAGTWADDLKVKTQNILKNADGNYGIYVKDLATSETFSFDADRKWYLASGVKLAVANEYFAQIKSGKISAADKHEITAADYRDGAGKTNYQPIGSFVTNQFLLEEMLIESDNAATDILIKTLGEDNINSSLKKTVPEGFSTITSLLEVRKAAYSQINDKAQSLTNADFLQLKRRKSEWQKLRWLRKRLGIKSSELKTSSLREAFEKYYATGLNSATLVAYGKLLESAIPNSELMSTMARATTGSERLKKGFGKDLVFAHKTGTQLARICDMGILYKDDPKKGLVITMCAEKFKSQPAAEKVFRQVGKAISEKVPARI